MYAFASCERILPITSNFCPGLTVPIPKLPHESKTILVETGVDIISSGFFVRNANPPGNPAVPPPFAAIYVLIAPVCHVLPDPSFAKNSIPLASRIPVEEYTLFIFTEPPLISNFVAGFVFPMPTFPNAITGADSLQFKYNGLTLPDTATFMYPTILDISTPIPIVRLLGSEMALVIEKGS